MIDPPINPYQPAEPTPEPSQRINDEASFGIQLGLAIQMASFLIAAFASVHTVVPVLEPLQLPIAVLVTSGSLTGFVVVAIQCLRKSEWPAHQRLILLGIDLLVGILIIVWSGLLLSWVN